MSQYCDTAKLEEAWFNWIMAKNVPDLEHYRGTGVLYSKSIGLVEVDGVILMKSGKVFNSPVHPIRAHCILSRYPFFFTTFAGKSQEYASQLYMADDQTIHHKPIKITDIFENRTNDINELTIPEIEKTIIADGYTKEKPTNFYWDYMLKDINKMCMGISTKFNQKTEEDQFDLAHEAFFQVVNKLVNNRLVYTPGRAPVFNLLTTTIYRCMYSIMNKRKNQREGINKLLSDASAGNLPQANRSLRFSVAPKKPKL